MRLNILIGGKAGQGINVISEIISEILTKKGYFVFNYRDYPSLIRGGHNFNVISISDKKIGSSEKIIQGIIALDENTIKIHKQNLASDGFILDFEKFKELGKNLNIALAGAVIKILGIEKKVLLDAIKTKFNSEDALETIDKGYDSQKEKFSLKEIKNNLKIMSGSEGIARGALD